ncbi:MAG TPA: DUF6580 family putative transport protein [Thermoplasmata archaeon]|jgi:hypothetical protein
MSARTWRASLNRGLGNRRTRILGVALIALGVVGKLVLRDYANFETVFVASFLAGSVLGRWWTWLVPFATLVILEPLLWGTAYGSYTIDVVLGLTFFIATGYLFIAFVGGRVRPRILFRVGSLALLTTLSIPLTIAYDLWTDIGEYAFIARPLGLTFWNVLELQVPFTIYHLLSSLIFVPLFGAGVLWLHRVAWSAEEETAAPEPTGPSKPAEPP